MDAIYDFIDNFFNIRFEDLPPEAINAAKKEVLDSLACALGGSNKAGVKELVDLIKEWGGRAQSTIVGYGIKCPAPDAALVNGTMIHALDYDDGHPVAQVHIGCVAVSTSFATAERQGHIDGQSLITALALGEDFLARLALASRPHGSLIKSGWHPTPLYGYLGSAAIAAKIIGLNREKMLNAVGIAYHQCAGNSQAVNDGALTKRLGPGLAARAGITSALMAERGISGAHDILEGQYGVFNQYHGGDYSREVLLDGLGKRFEGANIGDKPYPCCGFGHAHIDATLSLRAKYSIRPENVSRIIAYGGEPAYSICIPAEVKGSPRNPVDAQFSLPWEIAVALVKGKVTPEDFTAEAIQREDFLNISGKVIGKLEPGLSRHGVGPGRVTIILQDGNEYSELVEHCLGSVERPMSFTDCAAKFRECAPGSNKPLNGAKVDQIIELVGKLEELEDATEIIRMVG
ncbi:MAG TPA: MmgE/PrpD family protein [Dehalococcoidales bacterium]